MTAPTSREQFKDYCLRALGHPVIQINVDDDQVEDRIDEAFQYYQQFHYDAIQRVYVTHQLTAQNITDKYITVADSIIGINRVFNYTESNFSINMFDFRYQLMMNDMFNLSNANLSHYAITRSYINMIDQMLNGEKPIRFNRHTSRLYIDMSWDEAVTHEGSYLIIEAHAILDPDTFTKVYSDRMLKKYATALIKRQWGINMSKFSGVQLPGGITMNGVQMYQDAMAEIAHLEEAIRLEYEAPPMFLVG